MKIAFIIFARTDSRRLPNKIFLPICNQSLLGLVLKRIKLINLNFPIIIATSDRKKDDDLEHFANLNKLKIFRGPINNVILRAIQCCNYYQLDGFVRICVDRPFLPYNIIEKGIKIFKKKNYEFITNHLEPTYPKGCMTK